MASSPPSSPISPKHKSPIPKGFRAPPKPPRKPITEMSERELRDLHRQNARTLASSEASTSTYYDRISSEQAAIEDRLVEIVGVEAIKTGLQNTVIRDDDDMVLDTPVGPEPPAPRTISAKQRALARYAPQGESSGIGSMTFEEAVQIQQRAHAIDRERENRAMERKKRMGLPIKGEILSREERDARMYAFLNYKPTDSDLEDDDEDWDEDDEDPATWFEDDQDDGGKGREIIEPDYEDYGDIIRVDVDRVHTYNTFYEPKDEDFS